MTCVPKKDAAKKSNNPVRQYHPLINFKAQIAFIWSGKKE